MMFNQKMVACLKANGKVLREFADTVYIPFGSEYSIYLKNLNSLRAVVNITIDGTEAVPGGLVINANQEIDLERFVKDMTRGNRFKFIERNAAVEAGRGIKAEDGLIRISFKYAKPVQPNLLWHKSTLGSWNDSYERNAVFRGEVYGSTSLGSVSGSLSDLHYPGALCNSISASACAAPTGTRSLDSVRVPGSAKSSAKSIPVNDAGITVPGSLSEQRFVTISDFPLEAEENVIVLRILGETENAPVATPVTVKMKPKCVTCGRVNKATNKFCSDCGTALEVV